MTLDEAKAILQKPAVRDAMWRAIKQPPTLPTTPPWCFEAREIPTEPFRLLRACAERAVTEGSPDDDAKVVAGVVEDYAVEMQFGPDGVRSYREFIDAPNVPQ